MTPDRKKARASTRRSAAPERNTSVNGALCEHVRKAVRRYLTDMGSHEPEKLYRMVIDQVEAPLVEEVLKFTDGNQSRASEILGITRSTLRNKIIDHQLKNS